MANANGTVCTASNANSFSFPTKADFYKVRGSIQDGIVMRCGSCRCQCTCNCNGCACKNCKHHPDAEFLRSCAQR